MKNKPLIYAVSVGVMVIAVGVYWFFIRKAGPPDRHTMESAFLKETADHARYVENQLQKQLAENNPRDNPEKLRQVIHAVKSDAEVMEAGSAQHMKMGEPVTESWMEGCQVHIGTCKKAPELTGTRQAEPGTFTAVTCLNLIRKYTDLCGDTGAINVSFYENKKLSQTITTVPAKSIYRSFPK